MIATIFNAAANFVINSTKTRTLAELGLSAYDARVLTDDRQVAEYFETAIAAGASPKTAANWIMGDIAAYLNHKKLNS